MVPLFLTILRGFHTIWRLASQLRKVYTLVITPTAHKLELANGLVRLDFQASYKMDKKQDTNTEGETPENTNRTKNDPTKRQPSKKHVTRLMVLKNWRPMIFLMEKRFRIMLQYIKSTIKDFLTQKDVKKF